MRNRTSFGAGMKSFAVSKNTSCGLDRDAVGAALMESAGVSPRPVVENLPTNGASRTTTARRRSSSWIRLYVDAPTGAYEGFSQADMTLMRSRIDRLQGR